MIPYGRQEVSQTDIDAVVEVLKSDFLTQGPTVPLFEDVVKKHVGAKYAIAVNSAVSCCSLDLACMLAPASTRIFTTPKCPAKAA